MTPVSGPLITITASEGHQYLALARISSTEWRAYTYLDGVCTAHLQTITATADMSLGSVHLVSLSPLTVWLGHTSSLIFYTWEIGASITAFDFSADGGLVGYTPPTINLTLRPPGGVKTTWAEITSHVAPYHFQVYNFQWHRAQDSTEPIGILLDPADEASWGDYTLWTAMGVDVNDHVYSTSTFGANLIPAGDVVWSQGYGSASANHLLATSTDNSSEFPKICTNPILLNETFANAAAIAAGRRRGVQITDGGAGLVKLSGGQWTIGLWPAWNGAIFDESDPFATGITEVQHTPVAWGTSTDADAKEHGLYPSPSGNELAWFIPTSGDRRLIRTDATAGALAGDSPAFEVEDAIDAVEVDVMIPLD